MADSSLAHVQPQTTGRDPNARKVTRAAGPRPNGQGSSEAVVETLMADRDRFLAFLSRRVGSRDIAEEILQAAFLKSLEKGASIQDHDRVVPWFYQLLRNAVIDHYRRLGTQARALKSIARTHGLDHGSDQGLEEAVCECVNGVVKTLKPEYADVLRRVDLEETSSAQFADETGITLNNVGVRLHRARAALRKRLSEVCGACTEHACLRCTCQGPMASSYRGSHLGAHKEQQ